MSRDAFCSSRTTKKRRRDVAAIRGSVKNILRRKVQSCFLPFSVSAWRGSSIAATAATAAQGQWNGAGLSDESFESRASQITKQGNSACSNVSSCATMCTVHAYGHVTHVMGSNCDQDRHRGGARADEYLVASDDAGHVCEAAAEGT